MIGGLLVFLVIFSVVAGAFSGQIPAVSNASIASAGEAVMLAIKLIGVICLWNGLMQVATQSGLTKIINRLLRPITKLLFYDLSDNDKALSLISMNITANLLGLGNAATPLGIAAMCELAKRQPLTQQHRASVHMITLALLNCASVQLLPTTIAMLRLNHGAQNPMDVLPAIWVASICALLGGLLCIGLCNKITSISHL